MPPTWRAVLIRRDVAGQPDRDMARELGMTSAQVRNVLARARAALRDQLDEQLNPDGDR